MYQKNIKKALSFLLSKSVNDISLTDIYTSPDSTDKIREVNVVFPLAFTLHALASLPPDYTNAKVTKQIKDLCNTITKESESKYSYNFWHSSNTLSAKFPVPDDLDDTAYCLSALLKANETLHENFYLKIINLESQPGGPYYTWYINPPSKEKERKTNAWRDIDPVVNASLLYFMALSGINLENTKTYIKDCINKDRISSPYYPYSLIFYLYLTKYLSVHNDSELTELVKARLQHYQAKLDTLTDTEKLLYALSSVYMGIKVNDSLLCEIVSWQHADGGFPELPFCYEFAEKRQNTYSSNDATITSFILELLTMQEKLSETGKKVKISKEEKLMANLAEKQAKEITNEIQKSPLKDEILRLVPVNPKSAALLVTRMAFIDLKAKSMRNQKRLMTVSCALFFGWFGYTFMDDVIDGQRPADDIPIALELISMCRNHFSILTKEFPDFQEPLMQAFSTSHMYYFYENKRPILDYQDISSRISPYLVTLKFLPVFLELKAEIGDLLYDFFHRTNIIRQLNDDAHDWQDDVRNNRQTYITNLIESSSELNEQTKYFWETIMPKIIEICESEHNLAEQSLKKAFPVPGYLSAYLEKVIAPIRKVQHETPQIRRLLRTFK